MSRHSASAHPEHALEQAYIEKVHRADELARERVAQRPEVAGDKYAARMAREQMLARLQEPADLDALCFGRIDLDDGATHYLGRGGVRDEETNQPLVINWRLPAVAAFYTANPRDPQGLQARRRFQLDQLRLLGIVEDRFGAPEQKPIAAPPLQPTAPPTRTPPEPEAGAEPTGAEPEIVEASPAPEVVDAGPEPEIQPQVVDAILADMDRARGSQMRDIVATIEARQYELISDSIDGVLVVQGGPGSGKTAVALHRAAWLLFNHREELERSGVLIVGPNRAFMEYVAQVLPTLGEMAVVQSAVDRVPNLGDVRVRATESVDVARLKGDIRMAAIVQRAAIARVRTPTADVAVTIGRARIMLPAGELTALIDAAWRSGRTYLAARDAFRRDLVALVRQRAEGGRRVFRGTPSEGDVETAVTAPGGPLDQIWPTVTAPEVVRDLLDSRQRLRAAGGSSLSDDERTLLRRERTRRLREEPWTTADIPLLDEADIAVRGVTSSYGYVLADEAQDLSPMQLRMVFRRSGAARATLVGDIAQATGPMRFPDWLDLIDAAALDSAPRIAELAIGYRVPRQIMELSATLLPRVAPQIMAPRAVRDGPEEPRLLAVDAAAVGPAVVTEVTSRLEGERSVGVLVPPEALDGIRAALIAAGLHTGDVLSDGLARQITVLSAEQAKGLEFDHVVVVEPTAIAGPEEDWALVYIALTRATRTLSVLYSTPTPFELPAAPGEPQPGLDVALTAVDEAADLAPAQPATVLGARYTEALLQAKFLHARQHRRGTSVPYLAHLLGVSALVLEDDGTEDEAIAALLHDAVEDYGADVLDRIVEQFGVAVARIVAGCTDPDAAPETTWREFKAEHLRDLESAGPEVRRVALAEKLDNARALLRDYRRVGDHLWVRMGVEAGELLWYYAELADLFVTERPGDLASEFQDTVERLLDLSAYSEPVS